MVIEPNPGRRFHRAGEAGYIRKIYARLGARLDDSLAAHNYKQQDN